MIGKKNEEIIQEQIPSHPFITIFVNNSNQRFCYWWKLTST